MSEQDEIAEMFSSLSNSVGSVASVSMEDVLAAMHDISKWRPPEPIRCPLCRKIWPPVPPRAVGIACDCLTGVDLNAALTEAVRSVRYSYRLGESGPKRLARKVRQARKKRRGWA